MRFVNILETLGIGDVELLPETLEVLGKLGVVENFRESLIVRLNVDLLSSQDVCKLAPHVTMERNSSWSARFPARGRERFKIRTGSLAIQSPP